jgi:hypothetical protein
MRDDATSCELVCGEQVTPRGLEPTAANPNPVKDLPTDPPAGAAQSGAVSDPPDRADPDLAYLISAWANLPPAIRSEVMNLVRKAGPS